MARIIKVRTVPRGYVRSDEKRLMDSIGTIIGRHPVGELFMGLYNHFGAPQEGGEWSYMLRHNKVVIRITAESKEKLLYKVWLSPGYISDARRKQTKVMNIIARRVNKLGVAFKPDKGLPDALYYPVRMKNAVIEARGSQGTMEEVLTEEERRLLYGGITQFIPEVEEEIAGMVAEIMS